jgi:hypothetical protein
MLTIAMCQSMYNLTVVFSPNTPQFQLFRNKKQKNLTLIMMKTNSKFLKFMYVKLLLEKYTILQHDSIYYLEAYNYSNHLTYRTDHLQKLLIQWKVFLYIGQSQCEWSKCLMSRRLY